MESEDQDMVFQGHMGLMGHHALGLSKPKARRNVWTDKKNAALIEIVKSCPYPTPWRPKHGTNKEVWLEITNRMLEHPDIFDFPVHWEAAKEQLLKIIERQKMRRSLGDYDAKTTTERYVDEMIKHMIAEDAEKTSVSMRQKERANRRQMKKDGRDLPSDGEKKRKINALESPLPLTEGLMQFSSSSLKGALSAASGDEFQADIVYFSECDKLRREFEVQKEKLRSEAEAEQEMYFAVHHQAIDKFRRDQEIAIQQLIHETQLIVAKYLPALESDI